MIIKSIERNQLLFFRLILCCSLTLFHCNNNPVNPEFSKLVLQLIGDPSVRINQSLKVVAEIEDAGTRGVRYIWSIDNKTNDTTKEFIRYFAWSVHDTGLHSIVVSAIDKRDQKASPETLHVNVTCAFPVVDMDQNDTTVRSGDTVIINPRVSDSDGNVTMVQWQLDNDTVWYSSTSLTRIFCWNRLQQGVHIVRVRSIDNDNLISAIDSAVIHVFTIPCSVWISEPDTSIMIHQTLTLHAKATESKTEINAFIWTIDNRRITQIHDTLNILFGLHDTGKHQICLTALDRDSFPTNIDTINVTVVYNQPQVQFAADTMSVYAWAPVTLRAIRGDSSDTALTYSFFINDKLMHKHPEADSLTCIFAVSDSGKHLITAYAVSKDSVRSPVYTMMITVFPGYPEVILPLDTVISRYDTLVLVADAQDLNGNIESYLWTKNGLPGHSGTDSFYITYTGKATESVVVTVMDNDSLQSSDTISVFFNTSPLFRIIASPQDTVYCSESDSSVTVFYRYITFDNEQDSVRVTSRVNDRSGDLIVEKVLNSDSAYVNLQGPGIYYITLVFIDAFGHEVSTIDTVTVIQQHTICFAGHSIVCGMNSEGSKGGFRAGVLSGLREGLRQFHSIKAIGPITTPAMSAYPEDDSCFAFSGSIGRELHNFLRVAYKSLSADIWVLMLGANSGYTSDELNHTISIMDLMLARNPQTRVYMITSPPFPDNDYSWYSQNYRLKQTFNKGIRDSVAARVSQGFSVSVVEGAIVLTEPDTTFDSTWFCDHVHPNTAGYERLGNEILRVMRLDEKRAIRKELYEVE